METQVFQEKVDQITVNNVGDADSKIDNSDAAMPEDAPQSIKPFPKVQQPK